MSTTTSVPETRDELLIDRQPVRFPQPLGLHLEVPQPSEPVTPVVPDAPIPPADPDPGTPAAPEQPSTVPGPDEPATPAVPEPDTDPAAVAVAVPVA